MNSPGAKTLGTIQITAAGTITGEWTTVDLDGLLALLVQMRLAYGSGGTSIKAYLQTSLDGGTTPIDIACFTFTTAGAVKVRNLSALTPKTTDVTPSDGALTDDTSVDGVLGTIFRLKVVSVGVYAGSTNLIGSLVAR
jgi:hypothetical protein